MALSRLCLPRTGLSAAALGTIRAPLRSRITPPRFKAPAGALYLWQKPFPIPSSVGAARKEARIHVAPTEPGLIYNFQYYKQVAPNGASAVPTLRDTHCDVYSPRDGERRTNHHRRHCDPGFAWHDVPRRSSRPTQRPCAYFRQNAQTFHPHRARGQSFSGAFAI
jgi:hypothetical protein